MRVEQAEVLQMSLVNILIVDDYEPWRHFVVNKLQTLAGVRVAGVAFDGMDALQKAVVDKTGVPTFVGRSVEASSSS